MQLKFGHFTISHDLFTNFFSLPHSVLPTWYVPSPRCPTLPREALGVGATGSLLWSSGPSWQPLEVCVMLGTPFCWAGRSEVGETEWFVRDWWVSCTGSWLGGPVFESCPWLSEIKLVTDGAMQPETAPVHASCSSFIINNTLFCTQSVLVIHYVCSSCFQEDWLGPTLARRLLALGILEPASIYTWPWRSFWKWFVV